MERLFFCKKGFHQVGEKVKEHTHLCYEIVFYGYNSKGITKIGGKEYTFFEGDVAIIPPKTAHSEYHFQKGQLIFIGFSGENLPFSGIYSGFNGLKPLFEDILKEATEQAPYFEEIISCKLEEIITRLKRKWFGSMPTIKDILYSKNYITENYSKSITLSELSEMVGYSPDHFRHLFLKEYGISPKGYMIQTRLENAARLLTHTNKNCTDIAYLCGFSDSSQLSKMFKIKYGVTPLEYKKGLASWK